MTARRDALSTYERQLKPDDAMGSFLFIGTNTANAWTTGHGDYDLNYFPSTYTLPLKSTVNVATGARGNTIVSNAPKRCVTKWQVNVFDYDQALVDQFQDWLDGRTELRIYAFAEFMAIGYVSGVPIKRPRSQSLLLNLVLSAVFVVKSTMPDEVLTDFTTAHHSFGATFATHLQTYGSGN